MLSCAFVGAPDTVHTGLSDFIDQTQADEIIVASAVYDHAARLKSYELLSKIEMQIAGN